MSSARRIGRWLLYCAVALPPLLAGALATVPWWLPQLAERWIERKIVAFSSPDQLSFHLQTFSLYHLEITDFTASWPTMAVESDRIEIKYSPLALLRGHLQQVGIHGMRIQREDDAGLSDSVRQQLDLSRLAQQVAGLDVERVFIRNGELFSGGFESQLAAPIQFDSILEQQQEASMRYWVKAVRDASSLETGGTFNSTGNGEISVQTALTVFEFASLSRDLALDSWFAYRLPLTELSASTGTIRFEGQLQLVEGVPSIWVVLGSISGTAIPAIDSQITGLSADFGIRGQQDAPLRFWLQSRGKLIAVPGLLIAAEHQRQLEDLFPVLDLSWNGRIELQQNGLSASFHSTFHQVQLQLPDPSQTIRINGLNGTLGWKLEQGTLQSQLSSPLRFDSIELGDITGGRGHLILDSQLFLSHGSFDLRLAAPVDGQLQSWTRSYHYGNNPASR